MDASRTTSELTERKGDAAHFSGWSLRGRPRGRNVDSTWRRRAIAVCHASDPYGVPRRADRRSAASSPAVSGSFTNSTHGSGRGTGHSLRHTESERCGLISAQTKASLLTLSTQTMRNEPRPLFPREV